MEKIDKRELRKFNANGTEVLNLDVIADKVNEIVEWINEQGEYANTNVEMPEYNDIMDKLDNLSVKKTNQ